MAADSPGLRITAPRQLRLSALLAALLADARRRSEAPAAAIAALPSAATTIAPGTPPSSASATSRAASAPSSSASSASASSASAPSASASSAPAPSASASSVSAPSASASSASALPPSATEPALPLAAATIAPGDPVVVDSADGLTIAEMLDATATAGFGFVIALLALTAIPFVGLSTPFGLAIAFIGAQMLIGRARPWLPNRVRRFRLSVPAIDKIGRWLSRATRWMTHLVRARLPRLCRGGGLGLVGLGLVVQGLGLALPLPIPGSNIIFLGPILIYAIGLLEEDGVLVLVGHITTLAQIALAFAAWQGIRAALGPALSWMGV